MRKDIFYNNKLFEEKVEKKTSSLQYLNEDQKRNVDINMLLNRVKNNKQIEIKKNIIYLCLGILILSLMGIFITIIR